MSRSYNPFDEDEDDNFKPMKWNDAADPYEDPVERGKREAADKQRILHQEVMKKAQSMVDSSNRSLSLVYDSEKVGVDTAEELVRQGEALKRTERMVDKMEHDMKTSQRHINSIKSMFSGFTNYFRSKPAETPPENEETEYQSSTKLAEAMSSSKAQEENYQAAHPNLLKREILESSNNTGASSSENQHKNQVLRSYHQKVDNNLDDMSLGLSRLKNLALGLQTEIDDQDDMLGRLTNKVDKMDLNIKTTDKRIREEL